MTESPRPPESPASGQSSTGLDENVAGLLCYLLGFVSGIVFLLLEKKSAFVRFHATQSLLTFVGLFVAQVVVGILPIVGGPLAGLLGLASFVVWVLLMVKAWQGERYELPIVGEIARERAEPPRT